MESEEQEQEVRMPSVIDRSHHFAGTALLLLTSSQSCGSLSQMPGTYVFYKKREHRYHLSTQVNRASIRLRQLRLLHARILYTEKSTAESLVVSNLLQSPSSGEKPIKLNNIHKYGTLTSSSLSINPERYCQQQTTGINGIDGNLRHATVTHRGTRFSKFTLTECLGT